MVSIRFSSIRLNCTGLYWGFDVKKGLAAHDETGKRYQAGGPFSFEVSGLERWVPAFSSLKPKNPRVLKDLRRPYGVALIGLSQLVCVGQKKSMREEKGGRKKLG